jgi:hypothetical protein
VLARTARIREGTRSQASEDLYPCAKTAENFAILYKQMGGLAGQNKCICMPLAVAMKSSDFRAIGSKILL